mmetsp:Transcript_150396/g.483318  ORF Transcript_150396/g.483318 Transcript_150396/m.483318 type:complete len:288 (-) Transcript_150396:4480-5343(-)
MIPDPGVGQGLQCEGPLHFQLGSAHGLRNLGERCTVPCGLLALLLLLPPEGEGDRLEDARSDRLQIALQLQLLLLVQLPSLRRLDGEAGAAPNPEVSVPEPCHGDAGLGGEGSAPRYKHALGHLSPLGSEVRHHLLMAPYELSPLLVENHAGKHPSHVLLDQRRRPATATQPHPDEGALEGALRDHHGVQEPTATPVPTPSSEVVLDLRCRIIHVHHAETCSQAAPEPLDDDGRSDLLPPRVPRLQVAVPLLQGDGRAVVLHTHHQASENHVVNHHCQHEGGVVLLV